MQIVLDLGAESSSREDSTFHAASKSTLLASYLVCDKRAASELALFVPPVLRDRCSSCIRCGLIGLFTSNLWQARESISDDDQQGVCFYARCRAVANHHQDTDPDLR